MCGTPARKPIQAEMMMLPRNQEMLLTIRMMLASRPLYLVAMLAARPHVAARPLYLILAMAMLAARRLYLTIMIPMRARPLLRQTPCRPSHRLWTP